MAYTDEHRRVAIEDLQSSLSVHPRALDWDDIDAAMARVLEVAAVDAWEMRYLLSSTSWRAWFPTTPDDWYERIPVVYFLGADDGTAVKIGTSRHLKDRLYALRSATHQKLKLLAVLPGTFDDERRLHAMYAPSRLHGEWFTLTPDLSELIRVARSQYPIPDDL